MHNCADKSCAWKALITHHKYKARHTVCCVCIFMHIHMCAALVQGLCILSWLLDCIILSCCSTCMHHTLMLLNTTPYSHAAQHACIILSCCSTCMHHTLMLLNMHAGGNTDTTVTDGSCWLLACCSDKSIKRIRMPQQQVC